MGQPIGKVFIWLLQKFIFFSGSELFLKVIYKNHPSRSKKSDSYKKKSTLVARVWTQVKIKRGSKLGENECEVLPSKTPNIVSLND